MLSTVISLLTERGWFDPARPYDKSIHLTHGTAQWMLLGRDGKPECFVKFSDRSSLGIEAARCAAAARRFPGLAPEYLGHASRGDLEVLVTRAVVFRAMNASLMRSRRYTDVMGDGLELYFGQMRAHGRPASPRAAWHEEYAAYYETHPARPLAMRCLDKLLSTLSAVSAQDQHGDLVVNNLGLSSNRKLAIFDWEDYGAVDVPGLDLFTLHISMADALRPPRPGARAMPDPRAVGLDIDRMCRASGLPRRAYDELHLAYAFVFRFLKRNYGPDIRGHVDRLIDWLTSAASRDGRCA